MCHIQISKSIAQTPFFIRLRAYLFNYLFHFSLEILKFFPIYSMQCTDIKQTERTGYLLILKKCESTSDKLHPALYNFTVTCSSHMNWICGFILCTVQFIRSLCVLYCRIMFSVLFETGTFRIETFVSACGPRVLLC